MRIIDAHMHVDFQGFSVEKIIRYLDNNKIDKCWLFTWEELNPVVPKLYQHLSIENILESYRKYPDRIVPFYAPDPSDKKQGIAFENFGKHGIKGCGELKVTNRWNEAVIEDYLQNLSHRHLPLVFHMEKPRKIYQPNSANPFMRLFKHLLNDAFNGVTGYYISTLASKISRLADHIDNNAIHFPGYLYDFHELENRIRQFPEIKFIAHGPHFWNNISSDINFKYTYQKGKFSDFGIIDHLLESYDNLYCDISGTSGFSALNRDTDRTKQFLDKHAGKVLFGTDNTRYDLLGYILSLNIDHKKLEMILFKNAESILES